MPESACVEKNVAKRTRVRRLPFSAIPRQSKLFLDYLADPGSLREFYPNAAVRHADLRGRVDDVLRSFTNGRDALADVLADQNKAFGAASETFANIERLRDQQSVAIVTGQQAGLFTGPLYTIYKALTVLRSAEALRATGVKAVPIFWIATEDHDFEEVSSAAAIDKNGDIVCARFGSRENDEGKPVGDIEFDTSICSVLDGLLDRLPHSEYSAEVREIFKSSYRSGETFGSGFGRLMAGLFSRYGLVLLDPKDKRIKKLTAPLMRAAVERAEEMVESLIARSRRLEETGYHAQVQVDRNYFPLFWISDSGKRLALKRNNKGRYRVASETIEFTSGELISVATNEPDRLSPGVMLRPVIQDFLLPTLCYFGGGAEISYFAQNSEVYSVLGRPVTPIMHRQTFTVIESKHARTMTKFGLELEDLFGGFDAILPGVVEKYIDPATPAVFTDAEKSINAELDRLDQQLSKIDPTLADNLATRKRKIIYHIGALRKKFQRARIEKDAEVHRRLRAACTSLYPTGGLQERTLNVVEFLNKFGVGFVETVYDSIDLDSLDHRILYL